MRIGQLNVRGLQDPTKHNYKRNEIEILLRRHKLDILLLQDLVGNVRADVTNGTYINNNDDSVKLLIDSDTFADYQFPSTATECGILYHNDLEVSKLPPINKLLPNRNDCTLICGIILHSNEDDIGIYSTYRPNPKSDPNQLFEYDLQGDKIIIGGDYNLSHDLWGSETNNKYSIEFVNLLA